MSYVLFLLVTGTLFVRPAELIPDVYGWPIYEFLVVACLCASFPQVFAQLSRNSLRDNPITACVLGVLVAVVLSHLSHLYIWGARTWGWQFSKIVLYYLLLVATVNSAQRLRSFLRWLFLFILATAVLALLNFYGLVEFSSIGILVERGAASATGEVSAIPRLRSTGVFNDPNDLAMILAAGAAIGLTAFLSAGSGLPFPGPYLPTSPLGPTACWSSGSGFLRFFWLPPVGVFLYGIYLTQSRGGLLSLLASLGTVFYFRWGWKRALLFGALATALLFAVAKGRITSLSQALEVGTGQSRVQIWAEGLRLFRQRPVFGIGTGNYAEEVGLVAHNSFLQCFAELGFFGGAMFLGAFAAALVMLYRLWRGPLSSVLRPLHLSISAILVAFIVSMLSLSRPYVVPGYLVLGLATALVAVAVGQEHAPPLRFEAPFVKRLALGGLCFLVATYVFVRLTIHWT